MKWRDLSRPTIESWCEERLIEDAFFSPSATADPNLFRLEATKRVLVGPPDRQFVMGGVLLASAIAALERTTERPLVWATAQFLSAGSPGGVIDIEVEPLVVGGKITQARATSREGDRLVLNDTKVIPLNLYCFDHPMCSSPVISMTYTG